MAGWRLASDGWLVVDADFNLKVWSLKKMLDDKKANK